MELRPMGRLVRSRWIQENSNFRRIFNASFLLGGAVIKARMYAVICDGSLRWSASLKCRPKGSLGRPFRIFRKCSRILSWKVRLVSPTYCLPQMLYWRQYTKLLLWQQTCALVLKLRWSVCEVIVPVLLRQPQYKHCCLSQCGEDLPCLPIRGARGIWEWTRRSRSLLLRRWPKVILFLCRPLVVSDVSRIIQFCSTILRRR